MFIWHLEVRTMEYRTYPYWVIIGILIACFIGYLILERWEKRRQDKDRNRK